MRSNQVQVGNYTLTVSMATLYQADLSLEKAGLKGVTATFADVLEGIDLSGDGLSLEGVSKALRAVSVPVMVKILSAFLGLSEKKALEGPLNQGLPTEWVMALFNSLTETTPRAHDVEPLDGEETDEETAGNVQAA